MKKLKVIYSVILVIFLLLILGCSTTIPGNNNHVPEISSSPVTNILLGADYSYDVEASDPDGDSLTFSLETSPTGMTINATTGEISWNPGSLGSYPVSVKVSDGDLFDTQDFNILVSFELVIILSPPANVSATDSLIGKVQITWDTVLGASHYQVYRADSLIGTKTPISGWQTETSYDDTSINPGTIYWYWVKAAKGDSGEEASSFSDYDTGYSLGFTPLLQPPTNVSATDGMYSDRVEITWDTVSEATHYRVFRSSPLSPGSKTAISDWQTGTSFNDTTGSTGFTYYYSVKAATSSSGDNESDFSESDPGYTSFSYL